jgi:hypothetical protein
MARHFVAGLPQRQLPLFSAGVIDMKAKIMRNEFAVRAASLRKYFIDADPASVPLGDLLEESAQALDKNQVALDAMLALFDEQGMGAIYKNSIGQFGFVLPDASVEGAFRYQLFDKKGFFGHSTHPTVDHAILALCEEGFIDRTYDNTLDALSITREWKFSTEALALRTAVQDGRYTWTEADLLYADLQLKYDPDLYAA